MRVLIVGGGVAGLYLAARLARQGREPLVVERAADYGESGYAISLYPFGSAALHGISAYPALAEASVELSTYEVAGRRGEVIRSLDFAGLMANFGPTYMTSRAALIELLRAGCTERVRVQMGTTVTAVTHAGEEIEVELSDGSVQRFDLLVGCDGIHSSIRGLLFGPQTGFETGWVGWTWWGRPGIFPAATVRELWLAGALFGAYPAPGRAMYLVAVPAQTAGPGDGLSDPQVVERLRNALGETATVGEVDAALSEAVLLWPWPLGDVRSRRLRERRAVLCGDAATAFLPTAGVGASAALLSAAALAEELGRTDARHLGLALEHYLQRTTKPIRAHQRDSRRLAHAMFLRSAALSHGRELATRHMPVSWMIRSILAAAHERI